MTSGLAMSATATLSLRRLPPEYCSHGLHTGNSHGGVYSAAMMSV